MPSWCVILIRDTNLMLQSLLFKTMIYDVQPVTGSVTSFFAESSVQDESVTQMEEARIVKWLFTRDRTRNFLISEFTGDPLNTNIFLQVTEPFTKANEKPGDIDLLMIHSLFPQFAIACECKRVKIISTDGNAKINNAEKIQKAVVQAKAYQSMGFCQTYLIIIIEDDGRQLTTPNLLLRQGKSTGINRIFSMPWEEGLHPDIGVAFIYVSQMSGTTVNKRGHIGICVDKRANLIEQPSQMTQNVCNYLSSII